MNIRLLIYIILFTVGIPSVSIAQSNSDSAVKARQAQQAAQKKSMDSARVARQHVMDSTKAVRQKTTDSLTALRKYRESKRYKDSVTKARTTRVAALQATRKVYFDSLKTARKKTIDSTIASRKAILDKIRSAQKHRSDSLAAIRKYKESKRYTDSVAIAKKVRMNKLAVQRKKRSDSLLIARKHFSDSLKNSRKHFSDSLTAVRKKSIDSLKAVRKVKADSIAKAKGKRVEQQKVAQKQKEDKMQLAIELKIKKKHQAWSNEKMLKKKWSVPRQIVQNTFTRYNYFFNSDNKMDEALANMQRGRKENYDSLIALFPFNPDKDSAAIAPDMDSIIQKASIGIQIHDPRTKWGDDLYLLLGQAYYYKGQYANASIAFRYILSLRDKDKKKRQAEERKAAKKLDKGEKKTPSIAQAENKSMLDFLKHRSVHNESLLWLARTYTQDKQPGNAESVLDLLETDPNFPESLQGRLALEKANIYLNQHDHSGASPQLVTVSQDRNLPNVVRMRAAFINGQIMMEQQNYAAATESFDKVLDLTPKIDMDFYARKNKAYAAMLGGKDQDKAIASLKRVLNDGKYAPYYEQVYYVMGRLAANNDNTEEAEKYLKQSISSSKSTKKQKALSFASLGNLYYKTGDYLAAKNAYDSASYLSSASTKDSVIITARHRSQTLGSITEPYTSIRANDSMVRLATMTEKEQRSVIRDYIRMLERKKSDSAFKAENAGLNAAQQNSGDIDDAGTTVKWYFGNAMLMQQGVNEFKRKWGSRTLTDNWRRTSAISFTTGTADSASQQPQAQEINGVVMEYDENGIPTEASLLALIPTEEEEKTALRDKIQRAYMDMANAYVKELQDYPPAIKTLDTLGSKYPDHKYKDEDLYIRYLVALKQDKLPEAQTYSARLIKEYPNSKYTELVKPTEDAAGVNVAMPVSEYYEETYNMLMQYKYASVLLRTREAKRSFAESKYKKQFTIIEGIALAGVKEYDTADTILNGFITAFPADSLRPWADAALRFVKESRPAPPATDTSKIVNIVPKPPANNNPAAGNVVVDSAGNVISAPANNAAGNTAGNSTTAPAAYTYKPMDEHYVLVLYGPMEARSMGLKAGISDFNTLKFNNPNLVTSTYMLAQDQGFVVTKSFKNVSQARIYMNMMGSTSQIFREYKSNEYQILPISAANYSKLLTDKDIKQYLSFHRANYK